MSVTVNRFYDLYWFSGASQTNRKLTHRRLPFTSAPRLAMLVETIAPTPLPSGMRTRGLTHLYQHDAPLPPELEDPLGDEDEEQVAVQLI